MNEATETERVQNRTRNRLILVGIAMMFAVPILIATYLNSTWSDWSPAMTRNHGELIQPVVALPTTQWEGMNGQAVEFGEGGKWTLLTLVDRCDQACLERLGLLDNVRIALGQRGERLTQVLATSTVPEGIGPGPHLGIILGAELAAFADRDLASEGGVYLVDPLGNVMMQYAEGYDASDVRKDLERLLKYSKVGT